MIAFDTNVLVRALVGDDQNQFQIATEFINSVTSTDQGLICRETLLELVWVLERTYSFSRELISSVLLELIGSRGIVLEDVDRIRDVLSEYQTSGTDFSDLMIRSAATALGVDYVATFDKRFAKCANVVLLN